MEWHENENDYTPFALYLLQTLYACYRELDNRFVKDSIREVPKAKRVEEALLGAYVPVSKGELRDRLPEVRVRTIERVLGQMIRDGRIEKIGSYRDTRYRRV